MSFAQVMVSPTGQPLSLVICSSPGLFSLQIANTTGGVMTGAQLVLDLPPGTYYVTGSVTGATESDITNHENPVFSLFPIANNSAHTVTYLARIICGYANNVNFNYIVSYNSSTYTGFDTPLQNFYYPEPVITLITNGTAVIPVNQTITRNITVEQQGINSTLDTLIILDEHTTDIQVMSVNIGTLHFYTGPGPLITDTIILTGSDFPGGNGKFDAGESIIIGETVKLIGCTNGESTIKAGWGCFGQICGYYSAFPSVSPTSGNPSIAIAFTASRKSWGFTETSGWVEFIISNNGTGAGTAFNLVPMAGFSSGGSTYYPNSDWVNEIDSFSVNGNYLLATFNYSLGAVNGQFAHFTTLSYSSDPDGTGTGLDDIDGDGFFDDLPAGKSLTIKAHIYYDWVETVSRYATGNSCGYGWTNSAYQAFRFGYVMKNQCGASSGVNWIPNTNLIQFQTYNTNTVQTTIPSDLYDNTPVWFEHTVVTTTAVNNEGCPNDSVVYKIVLPPGVMIATGYTATFKNVSMGIPQIIGDTAKYFLNKSRILSGGLFRVPVVVKCNSPHPSLGSVHAELKFWCDKINYKTRYFTYWCADSPQFGIQCPIANCPDPSVSIFKIERQTLGWTNERCTTKVAKNTPGIRLDHAFVRDTVKILLCGKLNGFVDSLSFQVQHNAIGGSWGNQFFLDYLTDTLRFYDAETSTWHICSNLTPQVTNGTTSYLKTSFANLTSPGGCLEGVVLSAGDSLVYSLYGRVKNIAQTEWRTIGGLRGYFLWEDQDIVKKCNDLGSAFVVNGSNYPLLTGTNYQQIVLNGCSTFVYEGMITRSLDICGGDIAFPNEVRPYCVLDTMTFTLPVGFVYQAGSSVHSYFRPDGSYKTENIADPVIVNSPGATFLTFIRDNSWGYPTYYDCGNNHDRIRFNASPSCKVQGNYNYTMDGRGRYQFYVDKNGIYKSATTTVPITYTPPLMTLTPLIITAEGREDTVSWEIRICNNRSFAGNNNWIAFENISGQIVITEIADITIPANPVQIPFNGYGPGKIWIQAGNFNGSECRIYRLKAVYNSCNYDSLLIRHGYNCATYPANPTLGYFPASYSCNENLNYLFLDPKDVSLNVEITAPANPVNLCDTLIYISEVTNSQLSYAYQLKFTVTIPPGITIAPGTSTFEYPYNSGIWNLLTDPVNEPSGSNKWVYHLSSDPLATPFLKGVESVPLNGYRIKFRALTDCGFTSGTSMKFIASASNACGDEKIRTSYTPPIHIIGLPSNVNLYVINSQIPGQLTTCSDPSLIKIKVINLGPSSVSQIEKLGFNIDDAFDYIPNSLVNIHNGPSGITSNNAIGGIRYINFGIQPNLAVNDSIVFTFQIIDIDPASLQCDTITLETTTLLVAQVACHSEPGNSCLIQAITSSVQTNKPVVKDQISFGTYEAHSILSGNNEIVTINYFIKNTGNDTLHLNQANIYFFYDGNGNEIPDETIADSLFSQNIPVPLLLPGDSIPVSVIFSVPAAKTCRISGAIRLTYNGCICYDMTKLFSNIKLVNAGADKDVCVNSNTIIGNSPLSGYTYVWVPSDYLNSTVISDPVFIYPDNITQPDTLSYILFTTRSGNCLTQDTMRIVVFPDPVIVNSGVADSICSASIVNIQPFSSQPLTVYSWSATGSSASVSGFSGGSGLIISQTLFNSGISNEAVNYNVVPYSNTCPGDTALFSVVVHPNAPVILTPPSQVICSGNSTNIQLSGTVTGTSFSWTASGTAQTSGFFPGSGDIIYQTITNTGYIPGKVFYNVTPSANGCTGIPGILTITVNPLPYVDFITCRDTITTLNAKPFRLKGAIPSGGSFSGNGVDGATGVFNPLLAGTGTHKLYYTYTNVYGCIKTDSTFIRIVSDQFNGCGSDLTDIRDGKIYPTVFLGSECWMAANLNYGTGIISMFGQRDNCINEKYCFGNSPGNCSVYGGLYQWDEVMQYEETAEIQGLCPPGWHVPSRSDWNNLFSVYANSGFAGAPLKYTGFSGFNAYLSGAGISNQQDVYLQYAGFYWTSSVHSTDKAWSHAMNSPDPSISTYASRKLNAFALRCVRD